MSDGVLNVLFKNDFMLWNVMSRLMKLAFDKFCGDGLTPIAEIYRPFRALTFQP